MQNVFKQIRDALYYTKRSYLLSKYKTNVFQQKLHHFLIPDIYFVFSFVNLSVTSTLLK